MAEELQFDRADYGTDAPAAPCASCNVPLRERYFEINGKRVCEPCRAKLASWPPGTPAHRLLRALLFGTGWAVVGFVVYLVIVKLTGFELALISILIGFYVGRGVRIGSYGVGGAGYQALAMALTYLSITGVYYWMLIEKVHEQGKVLEPYGYVVAIKVALEMPFLAGAENLLGILIIGFGLFQAWKVNKRTVFAISGPFEIKAPAPEPVPVPPDAG